MTFIETIALVYKIRRVSQSIGRLNSGIVGEMSHGEKNVTSTSHFENTSDSNDFKLNGCFGF